MFEQQLVQFSQLAPDDGSVSLVGATIVIDADDYEGVAIAAQSLSEDLGRVSGSDTHRIVKTKAGASNATGKTAIIIGTSSSSSLIQALATDQRLRVSQLQGKWECFHTAVVARPVCLPGFENALVIAGSDKRGAMYGAYTICAQIGVSPWHWWADVPVKHHDSIFARPVSVFSSEPSVKYRGIFINDEAPALTGLVLEKFGKYGKEFYIKVFDLLLRLKGNFMWPAMWPGYPNPGSSFFVDDPENQRTAEVYGIVMSTSHHEPMQRATNEWFETNPDGSWSWIDNKKGITKFFQEGVKRAVGAESYFTMGMRGEYDKSMKTDDPVQVLRDVIRTQRAAIKDVHAREDAVPQLLALYKEVQQYWDTGSLEVPDDITLLFADDNFGSLRRLPTDAERQRSGGAGIYYHLEYVGTPRSYKWINSNSLGKTWHQLQEAYHRNARQIWIFNVGDIKPMEVPLSFVMSLAWDINSIKADDFGTFYKSLAQREFGGNGDLVESVARLWRSHDRLVSIRRHEHIEADNFSLLNYDEAQKIQARWSRCLKEAQDLFDSSHLTDEYKPAFFQLVLHPIKASCIYTTLRIKQAENQLWALQRRNSTNRVAREILDLFDADFTLSEEFHQLLDGKWNHIMRQTHYGFDSSTWHAPSRDMISGLCFVQTRQDSNPLVGQLGVIVEGHAGIRPGLCNEESDRTHPSRRDLVPGVTLAPMTPYGPTSRWIEIFTRGSKTLNWTCTPPYDWIVLSQSEGRLVPGQPDARIYITVDWSRAPADFNDEVLIDVRSHGGNYGPLYQDDFEQVHLPILHRTADGNFEGYVEADGYVSIAAGEPTSPLPDIYQRLPEIGRSEGSAVSLRPGVMAAETGAGLLYITYNIFVFESTQPATLVLYFNMTLDHNPGSMMQYDVALDEANTGQRHRLLQETSEKGELPVAVGWYDAVQNCVWRREHDLGILAPGCHQLRIRLLHSNMILEKLVVDLGGLAESYLGPPPTMRLPPVVG